MKRSRILQLLVATAGLAVALASRSVAQCVGWDPSFSREEIDGSVACLQVANLGGGPRVYAGGSFTSAGGSVGACVAQWDGVRWSPVGAGLGVAGTVPASVNALAVFDDGSGAALYAGGDIVPTALLNASRVARWNGATWSAVGAGTGFVVHAFAVFDDGAGPALYAGGDPDANGVNVARWDGTSWTPLATGMAGTVFALATYTVANVRSLYAGGDFALTGTGTQDLARWNGSTWVTVGGGVSASMYSIVQTLRVWNDGSGSALYAGGTFDHAGTTPANGVARWDGAQWTALGPGVWGYGGPGRVYALVPHDDGSGPALYAAGNVNSAGTLGVNNILRWQNGAWSTMGSGVDAAGFALCSLGSGASGALFVGGDFGKAGGIYSPHVARWSSTGWTGQGSPLGSGPDNQVYAVAAYDPGFGEEIYAAGEFTHVGTAAHSRIARWDGTSWIGVGGGLDGLTDALCTYDLGNGNALWVGGSFNAAGGQYAPRLARWMGSQWSGVFLGNFAGGHNWMFVFALLGFDDGSGRALYVGGDFILAPTTPGGTSYAYHVIRWNGSVSSSVGFGFNAPVYCLAQYDDGNGAKLYAGGEFSSAGSGPASLIACWSGTSWGPVGSGLSAGNARAMCVFDDGSGPALYVGGYFHSAGGAPADFIARWNGSAWSAVGGGLDGPPNALAVYDDGQGPALYAGGGFAHAGAASVHGLARWNGVAWSAVDEGIGGPPGTYVYALASGTPVTTGVRSLFVGGMFAVAGDVASVNFAQWGGCTTPATPFCFGDGSSAACPCANSGASGHGCENSAGTGGARLAASGDVSPDSIVLASSGEPSVAPSIFLQGTLAIAPVVFGDGLRCAHGILKRLYVKPAVTGMVSAPGLGEPSVSARSASLGDPISPGSTRCYQVYYRDPSPTFCPFPGGATFNVSEALTIAW